MNPSSDSPIVDGIAIALRRPEHTAAIFAAVDRSRDHLRPWFPWVDLTVTVADVEARYSVAAAQHARGELYEFVIISHAGVIGKIDLHAVRRADGFALLGYWLAVDAEGRGIMRAAIAHVLSVAFNALGMRRLELRTAVDNHRSLALARRAGFTQKRTRDADPRGDLGEETVRFVLTEDRWKRNGATTGSH